ncbi:MAG: DEAD/DEAH box helicase family protein [Clostridium sp.]|uniref:type I restriction endonuclease n=1 Tax=Clostridium sp. TaxID=1506 RepID=UPI002A80E9E3|nr:type I restriction endonuclease [Clostridium sp.]MCI6693368.1 DEAD/DEAH box helicase family protein [Clostridium sp.]MDY4253509.1 DEAD/DEAH box helicase family protein [Clostridium sp.]MDY6227772.1 DEAD/DEAH box helicase family protein [Clostridium sp.]
MKHDEDSRVKLPAIIHFKRLGYNYQSKSNVKIDGRNNIFIDIFAENIRRINNKNYDDERISSLIKEISDLTDNSKDKGRSFYERLTDLNKIKIIDIEEPLNNDFRVVTELKYKGERNNFRPDITILVNGIPLGFVEVKKPNNHNGIQEEFIRMKERYELKDCMHFFNQLQVLGFTNNQEYNDEEQIKMQGSFYTTPNWEETSYNHFREENKIHVNQYLEESFIQEVLVDNNCYDIRKTREFITNLNVNTPCNSFITSVFSKKRLIFFIRYGIVYVDSQKSGLNKHIIRYPQFFAITNLLEKLSEGMKKGVVWHTQGSGKTAMAYFMTNVLREYYQKKDTITKFYFVVDRLDLLTQAKDEFSSRGLTIASIDSKESFAENIKSTAIIESSSQKGKYKETINVVNIQKFSRDSTVNLDCNKKIQRIYFLDEVHRGYKPKKTFLANLLGADPNGIFIGLTGTPLLKKEFKSTLLFDCYIHKYFYNKSIADGYTLKIKKENISTEFRDNAREILKIKGNEHIPPEMWKEITKKDKFVEELSKYIDKDFNDFRRKRRNDNTLGGMIVSSSSEQAKLIYKWFEENSSLKAALILYEEEENKTKQEDFRGRKNKETGKVESSYDIVIVFNMLLTGFDSARLKRLYLLRPIKEHSLLQTIARVNRPYNNMKYGYIVDFVDITEEYEETIKRYLAELKEDIEDLESDDVEELFISEKKIRENIKDIEDKLFKYMHDIENNLELFRNEIELLDIEELRNIKNSLMDYRECVNELIMSHNDVSDIPIERLNKAYYEVANRISFKLAEMALSNNDTNINNYNFEEIVIEFLKTGEIDLGFINEDDILLRVSIIKNLLSSNADNEDTQYIYMVKMFKDIIKKFKNEIKNAEETSLILKEMDTLIKKIRILNGRNNILTRRYRGDETYMIIHKRLFDIYGEKLSEGKIFAIMANIIEEMDKVLYNLPQPTKEVILRRMKRPIYNAFIAQKYDLDKEELESIIYLFIDNKFKYD